MNILLFTQAQVYERNINSVKLIIDSAQTRHLLDVQEYCTGDQLRIGQINGLRGQGVITRIDDTGIQIEGCLDQEPPAPARCKLILALPRPKMLRRMLVDIAMLGIKDIVLLNSYHVQKSYWSSPLLLHENSATYLLKGLEQACDTIMPTITLAQQFKPFVEDRLPQYAHVSGIQTRILLADPRARQLCPQPYAGNFTLIIGPENGFTDYEIDKFVNAGAVSCSVGERHLRVETAMNYLLGRLL